MVHICGCLYPYTAGQDIETGVYECAYPEEKFYGLCVIGGYSDFCLRVRQLPGEALFETDFPEGPMNYDGIICTDDGGIVAGTDKGMFLSWDEFEGSALNHFIDQKAAIAIAVPAPQRIAVSRLNVSSSRVTICAKSRDEA